MKKIKLLLIEDDINFGYIFKSSMEDVIGEYEVDIALNGEEGLERLKSFNPDIIVSDIEMPVMDGIEMVKKIRQTNSDLPIIFVTGRNNPKDTIDGYKAGADNYIKKPFTPEELDAHIKKLIDLKSGKRLRLENAVYKIGKYTFEPKYFTLTYNHSEPLILTLQESQILELLLKHRGDVVKREDIFKIFWGKSDPFYASRSLSVFITKLRKYLSKEPSVSIKNIRLTGFILNFD